MALTNAERQARYQKRLRERAALASAGIAPEDVDRATRLLYEAIRDDEGPGTAMPPWSDWLASLSKVAPAKARSAWEHMVPDRAEPDYYPDRLSPEERQFLARVGAVIDASRRPPKNP